MRGGLLFLINFRDFSGKLKLYIRKGIFRKIPGIGTGLRLLRRRGRHRRFFEIRSVFPGPGRGRRRFLRPSGSCFLRLFCFRFTSFPAPFFSFRLFFFPFLLLPGLAAPGLLPIFPLQILIFLLPVIFVLPWLQLNQNAQKGQNRCQQNGEERAVLSGERQQKKSRTKTSADGSDQRGLSPAPGPEQSLRRRCRR